MHNVYSVLSSLSVHDEKIVKFGLDLFLLIAIKHTNANKVLVDTPKKKTDIFHSK